MQRSVIQSSTAGSIVRRVALRKLNERDVATLAGYAWAIAQRVKDADPEVRGSAFQALCKLQAGRQVQDNIKITKKRIGTNRRR